jgi:hypothetical protein
VTPAAWHTAATLPPGRYTRPALLDGSGLAVRVVTEDGGDAGVFDFSDVDAPPALLRPMVTGFAAAAGPGGRWRSARTVDAGAKLLRRFIATIREANPGLDHIDRLTPEVWWSWRARVESGARWPGQINLMRALLTDVAELPTTTRRALRSRPAGTSVRSSSGRRDRTTTSTTPPPRSTGSSACSTPSASSRS